MKWAYKDIQNAHRITRPSNITKIKNLTGTCHPTNIIAQRLKKQIATQYLNSSFNSIKAGHQMFE